MDSNQRRIHHAPLLFPLMLALALRALILVTDSVPFNSDEAVIGLMARHTLQGDWPVFFYGQSYMGSLDATLVAAAFALLGESVLVMRLVQTLLFLGIIVSTYALGLQLFRDRTVGLIAAWFIALPSVLLSTYTTATLGGYGEILLLGNLLLLLGHALATGSSRELQIWFGLGAAAGLGFWTSALIGVYLLPLGALLLATVIAPGTLFRPASLANPHDPSQRGRFPGPGILVAGAAFFLFSSPWWWQNLTHQWSALQFMLTGTEDSGIGISAVSFSTRFAGMILFGLPALFGMRFPWSSSYFLLPLGALVLAVYLAASVHAIMQVRRKTTVGQTLLLGIVATFAAVFLLSRFGTDATGRYFLPLTTVLALWTGSLLARIQQDYPRLAIFTLILLLGFNLSSNVVAISQNPPGLTTQFDPSNRFDNRADQELVEFLHEIDTKRGYSNYFVAFRIAFLSQEEVILSSQLPYKPDLSYNPADDRYPFYTSQVDQADQVVYITSIHPELDALLAERLSTAGIAFAEKQIGPYHLFYDLSRRVMPQELGFGHP